MKNIKNIKNIKKYLPVVCLIVGQVIAVCSIIQEATPAMWIGIALSAGATGVWARKTGRSIFAWVSLSLFPVIGSIVVLAVMSLVRERKSEGTQRPVNIYIHVIAASILFLLGPIVLNFCPVFCAAALNSLFKLLNAEGRSA